MRAKLAEYVLGDMTLVYEIDSHGSKVGLIIIPSHLRHSVCEQKRYRVDSLVQLKLVGDDYPDGFSQGVTMRNSGSTMQLEYDHQYFEEDGNTKTIVTLLQNRRGHKIEHRVVWTEGEPAAAVQTVFKNRGPETAVLEMLSSFSLGGITPFAQDEAPNSLLVHQLRSKWSCEGRLQTTAVEDLLLEPSWSRWGAYSHRFGQVGTMPVRGYFPFVAVEDTRHHVSWGVQLAYAGSWQMEVYRRDDALCLSGGLADREFGHWLKEVRPGEELAAPMAIVSVCEGGIEQISQRLTAYHEKWLADKPQVEEDLPIIFNEWCTSWGQPTSASVFLACRRLKDTGIKYFVIDSGWFAEEGKQWYASMGDWRVSAKQFPLGMEEAVATIREFGMIPGIWFEFENCGSQSDIFSNTDMLLKRDGRPLTVGTRRFLDLRKPEVIGYLTEKVIDFLKKYGFGYLKIDYNDTVGIGCDGAESLGEGLRQQVLASQEFIRKIQREIPDLVIENCASGGHRLEPSMLAITSMSSFSDAHECLEIPIIAANLHRAILPRQSQIWAVLRKTDSARRLYYSIVNTFLGRMCLSGDIHDLNDQQWRIVTEGMEFYQKISPIIKKGFSYRFGPAVSSYRYPEGWQVVFRVAADRDQALAVVHSFAGDNQEPIRIPVPENLELDVEAVYAENQAAPDIKGGEIHFPLGGGFQAMAVLFRIRGGR